MTNSKRRLRIRLNAYSIVVPALVVLAVPIAYGLLSLFYPAEFYWNPWLITLMLSSVAASVACWYFYHHDNLKQRNLLERGECADAEVTEIIRDAGKVRVRVRYTFDGKSFEETSSNLRNLWFRSFRRGDKVRLFLDPETPSSFVVYEAGAYKVYSKKYAISDNRNI